MTVYHGVLSNLFGDDRQQALDAMDDDDKFDRWMEQFQRKQQMKGTGNTKRLSNEQYLRQHAKVHGGEDE